MSESERDRHIGIASEENYWKSKHVQLHMKKNTENVSSSTCIQKKNIENPNAFSFAQPSFLSWRNLIMSIHSWCWLFVRGKSYVSGHIIRLASFIIGTSRAFWDVVGPTAWYRSTNIKYLTNSMTSSTLTKSEKGWKFPTWVDAMLQLTGQSACCCSRRKPSGESSCPVQIPGNTSPRVESLFTDRTPPITDHLHSAAHLDWH